MYNLSVAFKQDVAQGKKYLVMSLLAVGSELQTSWLRIVGRSIV
jgi:hypothetical protein